MSDTSMPKTDTRGSWFGRALRRTVTVTGTAGVFVLAGGLVVGGGGILAERADAVIGPDPAPLTAVSALTIEPQQSLVVARQFQGQVEPAQTVNLAFQQAGEIELLEVDEGDRVEAGQVLARLDTRILDAERTRLEASRRAVEAQVELAQVTTDRQSALQERGFASQQQLDSARFNLADLEARIAEIDASITRIDVQLSQTELVAPFAGTIATRLADEGQVVAVGQAIVDVLQEGAPMFRVGIDPSLASETAALNGAQITINGRDYDARFVGLRPDLDPQTRTRTALYALETDEPVYLQAGTLALAPSIDQAGYTVPLSALRDGVRGLWTVLSLTPDEAQEATYRVGTEAVEVLHLDAETAFVTGTMDGPLTLIPAGTHRVVPGERVRLITQTGAGE
ncbi:MAG: efflux RND transporter periplasmic adaptor subunit [Devosiaceae bacterium]|nr:efflux RND transporter periplasmic adaptor subunit [Devosiaceae bacterium MH13]